MFKNCQLLTLLAAAVVLLQPVQAQNISAPVMSNAVPTGFARSHAWVVTSANPAAHGPGQPSCTASNGCYYLPGDILTAYSVSSIAHGNGGSGMTVAIVDAYYNPQTEADLAAFTSQLGLSPCTIASGCLTIVNQTGGSPSGVPFSQGWAQETNLDVQMVHGIAPNAKILLVVANTPTFQDLGTAVLYAQAHANVVSNSYGANEFGGETYYDSFYTSSTVPILASSGDQGAVVDYPCASSYVTCVGGTNLVTTSAGFRNVESAWGVGYTGGGGSGGGCSSQVSMPAYQSGYSTCGTSRGTPDIAALADPNSGFAVYLGTNAGGGSAGFYIFGGTSMGSPLAAAIFANIDSARVAAGKAPLGAGLNQLLYQAAANPYYRYRYYDVTKGSSGLAAGTGWDEVTGLGVAIGPSLAAYLVGLP